ncbi:MAG: DUF1549 domain-containing protein [Roseimicrobium sp.]
MTRYLLPLAMAVLATRVDAVATAPVSFNRDVRPIFSKHCTACHGGVKAAGGISFVYRDKALAAGKSGETAIVAGRPLDSALIRRVTTHDPDELMPQPEHGPRLTDGEVAVLTRWIEQGATWSEHWSFVPPVEVAPPNLRQKDWPLSRLDAWVLARLEEDNLAPSRPAEPAAWLRRVSLDLTGLPPTVLEFEAFQAARQSGEAIAKAAAVDRLLQSPHFGERWASVWLDLARYSDTYGFEKDPHREIWPWRDWVIRAFNDDLPFDQFTVKQLAGDLLPSPSADDLLATAFHRNTQNNTEGGTDDEEFRTAAVIDRVNTTWTAWQATTFGCVQCHAHPYDPFPHRDYYRFAAFFNSTEDCDQNDDFPRLPIPQSEAQRAELARLVTEQKALRADEESRGAKTAQRLQNTWRPWSALTATASGGQLTAGLMPAGRCQSA